MSRHRAGARRASSAAPGRRRAAALALLGACLATSAAVVVGAADPEQPTAPSAERVAPETLPRPATTPRRRKPAISSRSAPAPIPERGKGTFAVASAPAAQLKDAVTYRVEVERGLPFNVDDVAAFVESTLADARGWATRHPLTRVDEQAALRIIIASPASTDELCAPLGTGGRLSCRNGGNVVINAWRWQHGADSYGTRLTSYRRYVVNHETGHALGYGHATCPAPRALAPVMLQQTKGLQGCRPNPWPSSVDLNGR